MLMRKPNRKAFDFGKAILNNFLNNRAGLDFKGKLSTCFELTENGVHTLGFYRLSYNSIPINSFPELIQ